jgi:hypothetical protein
MFAESGAKHHPTFALAYKVPDRPLPAFHPSTPPFARAAARLAALSAPPEDRLSPVYPRAGGSIVCSSMTTSDARTRRSSRRPTAISRERQATTRTLEEVHESPSRPACRWSPTLSDSSVSASGANGPTDDRRLENVELLTPHDGPAHGAVKGRTGFVCEQGRGGRVAVGWGRGRKGPPFASDLTDEFP